MKIHHWSESFLPPMRDLGSNSYLDNFSFVTYLVFCHFGTCLGGGGGGGWLVGVGGDKSR